MATIQQLQKMQKDASLGKKYLLEVDNGMPWGSGEAVFISYQPGSARDQDVRVEMKLSCKRLSFRLNQIKSIQEQDA